MYLKVRGSIPGRGTCLRFRFGPWSGHVQEATDQSFSLMSMFLSLSLSLPHSLPLSLTINKDALWWGWKKKNIKKWYSRAHSQKQHVPLYGVTQRVPLNPWSLPLTLLVRKHPCHPELVSCQPLPFSYWLNLQHRPVVLVMLYSLFLIYMCTYIVCIWYIVIDLTCFISYIYI